MFYPGRYMLPCDVVLLLERTELGPNALRLFHGLYDAMNAETNRNPAAITAAFHREPRPIRCLHLRDEVARRGTNDNRWIRSGAAELLAKGLFDVLKMSENGRYLLFKPGRKVCEASEKTKHFAPMRTAHIKECKTVSDILFLTRASKSHGSEYPTFFLPRIGTAPLARPWDKSRDSWLDAAVLASKLLGDAYLVGPIRSPMSTTVDAVKVKASHADTIWKPGGLYHFDRGTRPFPVVAGTRYPSLTADELKARSHLRRVQPENGKNVEPPEEERAPAVIRGAASKDVVISAAGAPPLQEGGMFSDLL